MSGVAAFGQSGAAGGQLFFEGSFGAIFFAGI